jgi:hypothetical protein
MIRDWCSYIFFGSITHVERHAARTIFLWGLGEYPFFLFWNSLGSYPVFVSWFDVLVRPIALVYLMGWYCRPIGCKPAFAIINICHLVVRFLSLVSSDYLVSAPAGVSTLGWPRLGSWVWRRRSVYLWNPLCLYLFVCYLSMSANGHRHWLHRSLNWAQIKIYIHSCLQRV